MEKEVAIGRIAGLRLSIGPSFLAGTIILWILLSGIGILILDLRVSQAVAGGLTATFLYWISEIVHQLGHAFAARRTGYPMVGIHLGTYLFFGSSIYPPDEPQLPAAIHIRRALGGPISSLIFTLITGVTALLWVPREGLVWWMIQYVCIINLLVFTLGPFLPLGFTDGSTLLKWRGKS